MNIRFFLFTSLLLWFCAPPAAEKFEVTKVAEGIYTIIRAETLKQPLDGNTTVIINDQDVVVVDATQTLTSANAVIGEIKKLTNKPVRYLVNTHWHNDHQQGNMAYQRAWPGLEIVAHQLTREDINTSGAQVLQNRIRQLQNRDAAKKILESGVDQQGQPLSEGTKHRLRERLALPESHLQELQEIKITLPMLTYEQSLTLYRGQRVIQLFSHGPGNTRSDTIIWLPNEKIVISGDLLVSTVPFMSESRPRGWLARLKEIAALDPAIIIPGHGVIQRDRKYLNLHMALLESLIAQVDAALRAGLSLEETRQRVKLDSFRQQYGQGDPSLLGEFDYRVTDTAIDDAYREGKEANQKK